MSGSTPDELRDAEGMFAEISREFRDGLPERVAKMRSALERLSLEYDAEAAERFYRAAHSLKGTAPSFDADELVEPATSLANAGLRWHEGGELDAAELSAAFEELERLSAAVKRYGARMEDDAAG